MSSKFLFVWLLATDYLSAEPALCTISAVMWEMCLISRNKGPNLSKDNGLVLGMCVCVCVCVCVCDVHVVAAVAIVAWHNTMCVCYVASVSKD